jgi:hypothetical protein
MCIPISLLRRISVINFTAATNTHNNTGIVGRVVFCVVLLVSEEGGRLVVPRISSLIYSKTVRLTENLFHCPAQVLLGVGLELRTETHVPAGLCVDRPLLPDLLEQTSVNVPCTKCYETSLSSSGESVVLPSLFPSLSKTLTHSLMELSPS